MIIARGSSNGGELLILGLSHGNINRLLAGQPMRMTRQTHGDGVPDGWTIVIMAGESEQALEQVLRQAGALGPQTTIIVDPRMKGSNENR
jgi:hypothetical protein